MLGNKICVTTKGLELISDQKNGNIVPVLNTKQHRKSSQIGSLPTISAYNATSRSRMTTSKYETLGSRQLKNNQLSKLSMTLSKYEKIGIKRLIVKEEDRKLTEILKEETKEGEKYLQKLIPKIIRKTRDLNKIDNLNSRYNRSRTYNQRLLHNYRSQANFGMHNIVARPHDNEEEKSRGKKKNL